MACGCGHVAADATADAHVRNEDEIEICSGFAPGWPPNPVLPGAEHALIIGPRNTPRARNSCSNVVQMPGHQESDDRGQGLCMVFGFRCVGMSSRTGEAG